MFDLKQILEYPCYENIQKSYGFTMEELELALEGGPVQFESEVYEEIHIPEWLYELQMCTEFLLSILENNSSEAKELFEK